MVFSPSRNAVLNAIEMEKKTHNESAGQKKKKNN